MDQNDDSYSPLPQPADVEAAAQPTVQTAEQRRAEQDRLERRQKWLDRLPGILVFATVYLILILLYRPNLMLSQTTTSGGDMGARHYPAKFVIDYLLPHFKPPDGRPNGSRACRCSPST